MCRNKRGAALVQVLMLSALLAGLSAMILRATLSRQMIARQSRHAVGARLAIESCVAEINNMFAVMSPDDYAAMTSGLGNSARKCSFPKLATGITTCDPENPTPPSSTYNRKWYCQVPAYGSHYCVTATISSRAGSSADPTVPSPCKIDFTVTDGVNL